MQGEIQPLAAAPHDRAFEYFIRDLLARIAQSYGISYVELTRDFKPEPAVAARYKAERAYFKHHRTLFRAAMVYTIETRRVRDLYDRFL